MTRCGWINKADAAKVAVGRQCALAGVCRATLYARQKPRAPVLGDEILKRLIAVGLLNLGANQDFL